MVTNPEIPECNAPVPEPIEETETAVAASTSPSTPIFIPSKETAAKVAQFEDLKKLIEKGLPLPLKYTDSDLTKKPEMNPSKSEVKVAFEELKTETKMLILNDLIMKALQVNAQGHTVMDYPKAASAIESISMLHLTKEMLLNNPEVVDTMRKLQRYCIRPETPFPDKVEFYLAGIKAGQLRNQADKIVENKLAPLFEVKRGISFFEVYCEEKNNQSNQVQNPNE